MFNAEISNIDLLRNCIEPISDIIDEAILKITDEGIKIQAPDRAMIVIVDMLLKKTAFDSYNIEKDLEIGINLSKFYQILKRSSGDLKISADQSKVSFESNDKGKRSFTMPTIIVSSENNPDIAKIETGFTAHFSIASDKLVNGVEDAELIGDSFILDVNNEGMALYAQDDTSSTRLEMGNDMLKIDSITNPVKSRYSVDYMKKMLKAKKISDEVKISLSSEYPMKLKFEQTDVEISFVLAQRVEV